MEGIKAPIFSFSILTFIYFLVVSSICTLASSQTDTLSRDKKIGLGQTLVSPNKIFTLGFFRPLNSQNFYFGIWVGGFKDYTVWVANREGPVIVDDSAALTIQDDGNLAVIYSDETEYISWSTNVSIASNTTTAVLLDTGNLVLKEGNSRDSGRYIWQSFDHPTHALLPGMKVGINLRTKQTQRLKSWKNDNDPTPGNFEFGIDVDGLNQFFIYRRSIPHVRAVFWNGSAYDDTSRWFGGSLVVNYSVADSETEVYFTINDSIADSETGVNHSSAIPMLVMTPGGSLSYRLGESSSISSRGWIGENDECSVPGGCGEYSTCNVNSRPVCKCLPGFEKAGIGCMRKAVLKCGREDGILVLKRVEMPEPGIVYLGMEDEGECREQCLSSSCKCKAYTFSNQSGCGVWEDDLKDIREEEHTQEELVVQDIVGIPVVASDLKPNGNQCSNCGANIIPYPLSTDFNCGHPNYNALFCNASSGQLSFRTLNGSYLISSINADTRTLVIKLEGVDLCWARSTKRGDIHLNGSQPFRVTSNNTILLFDCSTSESSTLSCTDSSVCYRYRQEGRVPCYNQEKCCSYVTSNSSYSVGVLSTTCNAYASIVNLNLSTSTYKWWEGVEVSWDPLPDDKDKKRVDNSNTKRVDYSNTKRVDYSNRKRRFPMIISTTITVGVFSLGTIFYFFWRKIKDKGDAKWHRSPDISTFGENNRKDLDVPFYEFRSVLQATENFSESNKIGQGGFGHVYKGKLPEGQEIAAKRLSRNSGQGQEEFKNEVMLIAKLQHRNLVRLLGYCIKEDELILLYEYMPNKSLDYFLFDSDQRKLLSWEKRHNIILGIAKGLLYLHEDSRLRIIHRDLKTSNILLDKEMRPKISDFGLARIYAGNHNHENTNRVVGTYGYMSPEYAFHGLFSVKSDVFSFGVILMEIISGKKNSLIFHNEESLTLLGHAWKLWMEEKWMDFVDANLSEACELLELKRCLQIGLLCVQENSADRPNMASVVSMFISETTTLQAPKQPAFITTSLPNPSSSSSSKNEVTISTLEGR